MERACAAGSDVANQTQIITGGMSGFLPGGCSQLNLLHRKHTADRSAGIFIRLAALNKVIVTCPKFITGGCLNTVTHLIQMTHRER
jgi:hypothetical protein